jgi:hypothetical protein
MLSVDALKKKTVRELKAMLALCSLDENADTELIERICDVIEKKENSKCITKAKAQKAWKRFKKQHITSDSDIVEIELVDIKKAKKHSFKPIFTALAAAAIIVLVVRFPEKPPQTVPPALTYVESFHKTHFDCNWIPDGFTLETAGTITNYSEQSYSIYTSGDKMFVIISIDINTPSEYQIEPTDVFTHVNLDTSNIKNGDEFMVTYTVGETKLIIYGDITDEMIYNLANSIKFHNSFE